MAQLFKIVRETKKLNELLKVLNKNKNDIKEIICVVRLRNGDIDVINGAATFETMCSGAKMLDFMINNELLMDNEQFDELEEETTEP